MKEYENLNIIEREPIKFYGEDYNPSKSKVLYKEIGKNTGKMSILENNVEQKLNIDRWFSDEVENRSKLEEVHSFSTLTLYRPINKRSLNTNVGEVLKFKANNGKKVGHWEANLVISKMKKRDNENFNGGLRYYCLKKTDFSNITKNEINRVVNLIKNSLRKVLGYFTSSEIFWEKVK